MRSCTKRLAVLARRRAAVGEVCAIWARHGSRSLPGRCGGRERARARTRLAVLVVERAIGVAEFGDGVEGGLPAAARPPPRQEGARDTGRAHTHTEAHGKRYSSSQCGRRARAHTRGGSCRCRRSSSLARQTLGSTAAARRQTARQAQTDAQARGAGRARAYRGELPVRAAAAPAPRCPASRRAAPCARTHTHTPKRLVSLAVPEPNAPAFARMPPRAALARRLRRTRRRAQGVCGRATIVGGSDQNTRGPVYLWIAPPRTLVPWKDTASPAAAEFCSQAAMRARRSAAAWPRGRE